MSTVVWLNSAFLPEPEARIGVDDGSWLHGAGLFETMLARYGKVFRASAHLARMRRSAEALLRPLGPDDLPAESVIAELLARNGFQDARVRLTVSAGGMRSSPTDETGTWNVCVTAMPQATYQPEYYEKGISVVVSRYRQSADDPLAGHKTTSYLSRLVALREARQVQCVEALWFTTRNELAEGSLSNVFLVKSGVLHTPPTSTPVLPGIARAAVLELAGGIGIEVHEKTLFVNDLLDAEECFLTNVMMQIMPVIRVERHDIAGGRVGVITRQLREAYLNLIEKECGAR